MEGPLLLPGHNDNVEIDDEVYHVQSETRGEVDSPYIVTLVFVAGGIVYRRKTEWLGAVDSDEALTQFKELLTNQHRSVIADIKSNSLKRVSVEEQKQIEMDERELIARFLDEWASE
ncbi:MAG TPA: hypothetical protein VM054_10715 [bacterium]|nr:hypothetical protein [bacterium]